MSEHPEESLQKTEREKIPSGMEDAQAEGGEPPTPEEKTTEASIEGTLRKEVEEWRDKFLRKAAEFENFRKRARRDFENGNTFIRQAMILEFLPIMDDFERLLSAEESEDEGTLSEGARLIHNKLSTIFSSLGIEKIEAENKPFDHDEHDAVLTVESADHPANVVISVVQSGYKMNGKVIRHAQVVVSKPPEEKPESNSESKDNL